MVSLCLFCCGEGEEEGKFGAVADPDLAKEFEWDRPPLVLDDHDSSKARRESSDVKRIRNMEEQISLFAKHRPVDGTTETNRRATILGTPVDLDEDFNIQVFPKTDDEIASLKRALNDNFIFQDLAESERRQFISTMEPEIVPKGAMIIRQGDIGDYFYVVESGTVLFVQDGETVGRAEAGASFGELALLYGSPRAVSCVADSEVTLWKVGQKTFRHMLAHHDHDHRSETEASVRKIALFKDLDNATVSRFCKALTPVHWRSGTKIVQKGEEGTVFYIIEEGNVRIHDIGFGDSQSEDVVLGPGEWFGERALVTGEPRVANATAMNAVTTLAMDKETFDTHIGKFQDVIDAGTRKNLVQAVPIFATLNPYEICQIASLMQEVCYPKGHRLAESGSPYQMNLWIIRHGRLLVYSDKHDKLYNFKSGDYFGDKSIKGDPGHISTYTATCEENLTTWVLSREQIESVIGDIDRLGQSAEYTKSKTPKSIPLDDLRKRQLLGKGGFGDVWLVSHDSGTEEPDVYALKMMKKAKILDAKLEKSVLREKELLNVLDHPFILSLVASYQDEDTLYLLLPLVLGGELFEVLHKQKEAKRGIKNSSAAFYCACIIEALGHFHQRQIAYRDLKLENVLIDDRGYCKLVDLGFAKVVSDKTYTLCGTPEYLAPEIIMSKGHDQAVDYWAFGVVVFELVTGETPFYARGRSQVDMFKHIVLVHYEMPTYVDEEAKSLIEKLLVRRQNKRLGNLANGYLDIKTHTWFINANVEFKKIIKKEAKVPWVPQIKDAFDTSNFEDMSSFKRERETTRRLRRSEQELFKGF